MAKWIVSLNDGQQISIDDLLDESRVNPWRKLLDYLKIKDIDGNQKYVTLVQLVVNGVVYNSPSLSKVSPFYSGENVSKFWIFFKDIVNFAKGDNTDNFISFSYRVGDYRNFLWVNTKNNFVYTQILNVINPSNKIEQNFSIIEQDIEESYKGINGGTS